MIERIGCRIACLFAAVLPALSIPNFAFSAPAWELDSGAGRIVLLGSIHFLRADDYPLPDVVDGEYERADTLILELDLDDIDESDVQVLARTLGTGPDYVGLSDFLGAGTFAEGQALAENIGIDLRLFEPLEPWLAAVTITSLRLVQLGYEPAHGIESHLVRRAALDGKEVLGLETAADQFEALDNLPAEEQALFLMTTLEEAASADGDMRDLVDSWRSGNAEALAMELTAGLDGQPTLYREIVVHRNRDWADQIETLARDGGNYLIVVGALHLVGADSLIAMLGKRGLEATRIPPTDKTDRAR